MMFKECTQINSLSSFTQINVQQGILDPLDRSTFNGGGGGGSGMKQSLGGPHPNVASPHCILTPPLQTFTAYHCYNSPPPSQGITSHQHPLQVPCHDFVSMFHPSNCYRSYFSCSSLNHQSTRQPETHIIPLSSCPLML
jgi:hypothetical protein